MGPRRFRRGSFAPIARARDICLALQWGRDVSVAEVLLRRDSLPRRERLQWGRDVSVAEVMDLRTRDSGGSFASMGPRRFRRGSFTCNLSVLRPVISLQWGRDVSVAEVVGWIRNAARGFRLQWGRDVSVAEVTWLVSLIYAVTQLQWGRDVSVAEVIRRAWFGTNQQGFNGAATFPSRKSCTSCVVLSPTAASMGPRRFRRGSPPLCAHDERRKSRLQWGRDVSVAEVPVRCTRRKRHRSLQWGRDVSVAEVRGEEYAPHSEYPASMGPRRFRRGSRSARAPTLH